MRRDVGAAVGVDDDGVVGTVAIASPNRDAVYEAQRQIELILDPPTAEVGAIYEGWHGDAAFTAAIGDVPDELAVPRLLDAYVETR